MWKTVNEFPDYFVNENGDIWSNLSGKILKQRLSKKGYPIVMLRGGEHRRLMQVHRIVAEAFVPNPNNYPHVNHKDENKRNNSASNLEWCTPKYNNLYGTVIERRAKNHRKKVVAILPDGSEMPFMSIKDAAKSFSCSTSTIQRSIMLGVATSFGVTIQSVQPG